MAEIFVTMDVTYKKGKEALEAARHELTTLHGLIAADISAPHDTWTIDASRIIAQIDDALAGLPSE